MAKYRGTLRKNPLEGGFFELHSEGGEIFRLEGAIQGSEGDRVEISGKPASEGGAGFGIHMTASPALVVSSMEILK